jgi:hypothetical protein
MQLFKNPFIVATNLPGVVEVLLTEVSPKGSYWEAAFSQTFDGTYTTVHTFNPAGGGVELPPIRSIDGFLHPGVTATQLGYIQGQSKGLRSRGVSWIFGRPDYNLGGPPVPLVEDAQFFMRVRRLDTIDGGSAGSSPGAGTTYNDATKDFPALGVSAGDVLIIEAGGNAGEYLIDTPNIGSLTLDVGTPLPGASGPEPYRILRPGPAAGGAHVNYLIPRPYWNHGCNPGLTVEAAAPNGASIADSEVVALPQRATNISIKNQEAAGGNDLIVALDDDGPEFAVQPQETLPWPLDLSTHLVALRGNGGAVDFRLIASY